MLEFDLEPGALRHFEELQPGQLFFHRAGAGHALAVALQRLGPRMAWLNLTGAARFHFGEASSPTNARGLVLRVAPSRLRLRVDEASANERRADPELGQLTVCSEGRFGVVSAWRESFGGSRSYVAMLDTWEAVAIDDPTRFVFDRWTLSYVDDAGQWVDVVRRET